MKKTNKILTALLLTVLAAALLAAGFTVSAEGETPEVVESGSCGEQLTWTLDSEGLLTISGEGPMTDYPSDRETPFYSNFWEDKGIRSLVIDEGVTTIGSYAFSNCRHLVDVSLPDSLTSIHKYGFYYCDDLQTLAIPDSVTSIGTGAFSSSGLKSISIPDSITRISSYAFYWCTWLTDITIPDTVTSIGDRAFYNCWRLYSISIPEAVTTIGNNAFNDSALDGAVLSKNVTSIGKNAFGRIPLTIDPENPLYFTDAYGSLLEREEDGNCFVNASRRLPAEYVIPDGVARIGDEAFRSCALKAITIPPSVTAIGVQAFYECSQLTGITIPDSVTSIGVSAFSNCTRLKSVALGTGLSTIGKGAFSNSYCIESMFIPKSVTAIGEGAFRGLGVIQAFEVDPENPAFCAGEDGCLYSKDKTLLIAYPIGSTRTFFEIPDTVTEIASEAFCSVTWPESYTYPYYSGHLQSITVPASVTSIGTGALANNRNGMRWIKILNPDCVIDYNAYVYWVDGLQLPGGFTVYGYPGSTAEASANELIEEWYMADTLFCALCPADDSHTVVRADGAAATCTVPGNTAGWYCEDCGCYISGEAQPALGHSWGEWVVVKQATTDETGLMRRTCANDPSHVEEQVIPKLQPQTSAFQQFVEKIREFFQDILDWFGRLFRW